MVPPTNNSSQIKASGDQLDRRVTVSSGSSSAASKGVVNSPGSRRSLASRPPQWMQFFWPTGKVTEQCGQ